MKLNLEIELDWIDEEMNLDETVKQNVIDAVVNKVQKGIEEKVEKKINEAIDATVITKINEKTEVLAAASMKIGEAMYKTDGSGGMDEPGAAHNEHKDSGDEKVVDGQFKDVTDNK